MLFKVIRPSAAIVSDRSGTKDPTRLQGAQTSTPKPSPRLPVSICQLVLSDRQISFEVRYINGLNANTWRNRFDDRLKPIQPDSDLTAWFIDEQTLSDLLTHAQADSVVNVLQAPKVTSFENKKAAILNRDKQYYVSGLNKIETSQGSAFEPIVKDLELGFRIDLAGSFLADGTRLVVDLRDSRLLSLHDMVRVGRNRGGDIRVPYQIPEAIERRFQLSCDVPERSSLVISVGLDEREGNTGGAAGLAGSLLGTFGLPIPKARTVTCERLVIIKPRKIVLESEEPRIPATDRAKSKPE